MDTSLMDCDIQPTYVRVTIRDKVSEREREKGWERVGGWERERKRERGKEGGRKILTA